MALVSFDPVGGLLRLQEELDRFFGKPLYDQGLTGPNVFPLVNVFSDKEGGLVVRAEVPGIKPGALNLQVEAGRLTIGGERAAGETKASYHRRERGCGTFSRTLHLPADLDGEKAEAEYRNGVLTVRIPKLASAKPRQIAVRAS